MQINCISFCELLHLFTDDVNRNNEILKGACEKADFKKVERLYIGSNFCSRYFLKYVESALKGIAKLTEIENGALKVTLCVPVFSQLYIESGKELITSVLNEYSFIDELTVNDFGMLEFASQLNNIRLNVGRMMNKDARDVRYAEYFNLARTPEVFTLTNSVLKNYDINCYELDLTSRFLDVKNVNENVAIYYPYVFATVGNICEFAGVSLPIEKKFRSNYHCAYDCIRFANEYRNELGNEYLKVGKTTYFKVDDFVVKADKPYRMVYEPFDGLKSKGEQKWIEF